MRTVRRDGRQIGKAISVITSNINYSANITVLLSLPSFSLKSINLRSSTEHSNYNNRNKLQV